MKRTGIALALLALGYLGGTLAPTAHAADPLSAVASELRGIRLELHEIRRTLERGSR